jgi:signal peptidase II
MIKKPYIIAFFFFMIDLFSKQIIDKLMSVGESIKVINNFFYITYTHNKGAAWSILEDQRILLLIISAIALYLINMFMNKEKLNKVDSLAYGMIIGGIVGNLIDRVIRGYVIDFIHFKFFGYDYPVFNLADTFIVVGIIILMIITVRKEYHERSKSRRK